jgi:agmatinase
MTQFDPDGAAVGDGIFGLPQTPEEAGVVLIPVPWEATCSYGSGTAQGPEAILAASRQLDLQDRDTGRPYEAGIAMLPIPEDLRDASERARDLAEPVIAAGSPGEDPDLQKRAAEVNALGDTMNTWVQATAATWLDRDRLVGVVGGDHSVPFGLIRAVAERNPGVGILHLDAHADMRVAYEGFTWSHASIMANVLQKIPEVARLVQIGIRDYSGGEDAMIAGNPDRVQTFFDTDLRARLHEGEPWAAIAREVVAALPDTVHLSFDIDGLDPSLCPGTGTPVPGGLSFAEITTVLRELAKSGRRVVGLDLCEVAPDPSGASEIDANIGARLLYKMIGFALQTRS